MDIVHSDVAELKELLRTLIEVLTVKNPDIVTEDNWVNRMYN